ncbi:hypothetical protein O4H61_12840 [Roseovarius aestuarii]|nr:hypothetical protein [Roseovarius aestuarii]
MGQVHHGRATTRHAVRAAIQRPQASLAQLIKKLGINPKAVAKWRKRATIEDLQAGLKEPRSTVLTEAKEVMIVAFRRHNAAAIVAEYCSADCIVEGLQWTDQYIRHQIRPCFCCSAA